MGQCNICQGDAREVYGVEHYPVYVRPVEAHLREAVPLLPLQIGYCPQCNHSVQLHPPFEMLEQVYRQLYGTYHSTATSSIGAGYAEDFAVFSQTHVSGQKMLEIGCSDGHFLNMMRSRGWEVSGCDPSPLAAVASRMGIPVAREYFRADLFGGEFDCVVMRHVLEHLPSPIAFLAEVRRVLAPGGYVAIEVPDLEHTLRLGVVGAFHHEHISYFTRDSLTKVVIMAGLRPVAITREHYALYLVARNALDGEHQESQPGRCTIQDTGRPAEELWHGYAAKLSRVRQDLSLWLERRDHEGTRLYIYGGGGHTEGLLGVVSLPVAAIIDTDPGKWNKFLPGWQIPILSPDILPDLGPQDVVLISSDIFQNEIARKLAAYAHQGFTALTLYPSLDQVSWADFQ